MFGIGINLALVLATIALGYWICVKASKETGFLKALGAVLGMTIIVLGLFSSLYIFFSQIYLTRGITRAPRATQMMPRQRKPNIPIPNIPTPQQKVQ